MDTRPYLSNGKTEAIAMLDDRDRQPVAQPQPGAAEPSHEEDTPTSAPAEGEPWAPRSGPLDPRRVLSPILGAVSVLVLGSGVLVLVSLGSGAPAQPTPVPTSNIPSGQGAAMMSTVVAFRMAAAAAPQVAPTVLATTAPSPAPTNPSVAVAESSRVAATATPAVSATAAPTSGATASPSPVRTATALASPPASTRRSTIFAGGTSANLRANPGVDAPVAAVLQEGTEVTELGPQTTEGGRTWKRVRAPDGTEGWIVDDLLVQGRPTPTATPRA